MKTVRDNKDVHYGSVVVNHPNQQHHRVQRIHAPDMQVKHEPSTLKPKDRGEKEKENKRTKKKKDPAQPPSYKQKRGHSTGAKATTVNTTAQPGSAVTSR